MSFKDNKECVIYSKGDNIEIISHDKEDEVIEKFFESLLSMYQIGFEKSMIGSDFIF